MGLFQNPERMSREEQRQVADAASMSIDVAHRGFRAKSAAKRTEGARGGGGGCVCAVLFGGPGRSRCPASAVGRVTQSSCRAQTISKSGRAAWRSAS
jgi:hypothetical protein